MFGAEPNITSKKLPKRRSYEKLVQKTLVKFTPREGKNIDFFSSSKTKEAISSAEVDNLSVLFSH